MPRLNSDQQFLRLWVFHFHSMGIWPIHVSPSFPGKLNAMAVHYISRLRDSSVLGITTRLSEFPVLCVPSYPLKPMRRGLVVPVQGQLGQGPCLCLQGLEPVACPHLGPEGWLAPFKNRFSSLVSKCHIPYMEIKKCLVLVLKII